ncbi:uncharacterized protein LOC123274432 [Cotesia glomerata]|uniref:uncharacterized protein LOC123274432 n=1 Tax=Cotesia glomerata TaxID=32391 RepID=UPI001D0117AA|nr:uncharacterized protein LOC123274432 [Cotesia glomerata]
MTARFAQRLGLQVKKCEINVNAIGDTVATTKFLLTAKFKSRINEYSQSLSFLTVDNIGGLQPLSPVDTSNLCISKGIKLADPEYYKPQEVDILRLDYWRKRKEVATNVQSSSEEIACEEHYSRTYTRDKNGRYVLALLFKENTLPSGDSRPVAERRLQGIIRKMRRDPDFKKQYTAVMQEYIDRGYMTKVQVPVETSDGFFLPYHAVIKETSTTTKVRIVFDGSAKSTSGISLNEQLMTGPILQDSLFTTLIRFRAYKYVLTGDIEKMYLQFLIRPEDQKYLRVLWVNEDGEIGVYEFNVVIFGITSSSFQAIRSLQQLAHDEGVKFSLGAKALLQGMYVDNCLTGSDSIEEALKIRDEIRELLPLGGLNMRQWASNEPKLLEGLSDEDIKQKLSIEDNSIKTLGLQWDASKDVIEYKIREPILSDKVTKRTILSSIAKIFDPLGLLSPIIVKAKIIMQQLWDDKVAWDESVPQETYTKWQIYCKELPLLNSIHFERLSVLTDSRDSTAWIL